MSLRTFILPGLATLLVPTLAAAQPDASAGHATGATLELRLESAETLVDDELALPGTDAGVFVGYQLPRVAIGVGFDLGRINESRTAPEPTGDSEQTVTTFLITPGVRASLLESADGRTELLASADVGLGRTSLSTDSGDDPEPVSRLRVQAGPGLRYWLAPSFALGATTGIRYDRMSFDSDAAAGGSMALSNTSLYTTVNLTGVF